ncbi:MAG: PQQ-binding-like beta-propeller repeat protein [Planctomycetes bacterium]|nr:PQQ-binding-like beta-propeller repeat protein [Planctomycetota bacterium]
MPKNWDVVDQGSPFSLQAGVHVTFMDEKKTVLGLWDTESRKLINCFAVKSDRGGIRSVDISRDRKRLAVAYKEGVVDVWMMNKQPPSDLRGDVEQGQAARPISPTLELTDPEGNKQVSPHVAFSPNGQLLATASDGDRMIRLWDLETGKVSRRLAGAKGVDAWSRHPAVFSPDGKLLATGGIQILLWDVATGQKIRTFDDLDKNHLSLAFLPDGKTLASCENQSVVHLWDVSTGKVRWRVIISFRDQDPVHVHYTPRGELMTTREYGPRELGNGATLYDMTIHKIVARSPRWDSMSQGSPFFPQARAHVTFTDKNRTKLALWDSETGKLINEFNVRSKNGGVCSVAVSQDRKRLAVAYDSGRVDVWLLDQTRKDLFGDVLPAGAIARMGTVRFRHSGWVKSVAFCDDGKLVVSESQTGNLRDEFRGVRLWDATSGKELRRIPGTRAVVAPDGKTIATISSMSHVKRGIRRIRLFDLAGKEIRQFEKKFARQTGKVIWRQPIQLYGRFAHTPPFIHDTVVYVFSKDFHLIALDADMGNVRWKLKASSRQRPVVHGNSICLINENRSLYCLDIARAAELGHNHK